MAGGRQYYSSSNSIIINPNYTNRTTTKSPYLLAILTILSLSLLFYIFSFFSVSTSTLDPSTLTSVRSSDTDALQPRLNPNVDYSFLVSLEKFLSKKTTPNPPDDTVADTSTQQDVSKLDNLIWTSEISRLYNDHPSSLYASSSFSSPLRVYVYEMPAKFTYDMLWLFLNTYKDTFNLTSNGSPVHRLIEQHSIDYWLWADLIAPESERLLKNVVRVQRQEDADLFYVPFFTTISFFLLEKQQCKALYRVNL